MKQKVIGLIGLGKMGRGVARRLLKQGYSVVATDLNQQTVEDIASAGAIAVWSAKEVADKLPAPRTVLLLVPSGASVDRIISELTPNMSKGDVIADLGNSFYRDSQVRMKKLKEKGINFLDVGMSGGISAARNGACLMVGGDKEVFKRTKHVFEALSNNGSYKYLGKSGAGHLVKGYHNLAEYGFLQSLAEALSCLHSISEREKLGFGIEDVCEIWSRGSILESRLTRDAETALKNNPSLEGISGSVFGQTQKEMERLVKLANDSGIRVPSCEAALKARIHSKKEPTFAGKIINAVRNVFGGHEEWKKQL